MQNVLMWLKSSWSTLVKRLTGRSLQIERQTNFSIDWVIANKLAVGRVPRRQDIERLTQAKIQVILSLCPPSECPLPPEMQTQFQCHCLPLPDSHYEEDMRLEQLHQAVGIVYKAILNQQPIYVHCRAGVERSPTVCIAYLCRVQGMDLWRAFNHIKQVRPQISPNNHQVKVIREYLETSQRKQPKQP
jgi:atypical dual specificity phosphatase